MKTLGLKPSRVRRKMLGMLAESQWLQQQELHFKWVLSDCLCFSRRLNFDPKSDKFLAWVLLWGMSNQENPPTFSEISFFLAQDTQPCFRTWKSRYSPSFSKEMALDVDKSRWNQPYIYIFIYLYLYLSMFENYILYLSILRVVPSWISGW